MQSDSESRSRYLALALDARKVIDALLSYVETGNSSPQDLAALDDAVGSLESIKDGTQLSRQTHSHLAFDHYEQVTTLDQVRTGHDREQIIDDLLVIKTAPAGQEPTRAAATRAIQFFFAVESRALQYYNRPPVEQGAYHLPAWRTT